MIYEFPLASDAIRQGDIFVGIPRIEFSLKNIVLASEKNPRNVKWTEIVDMNKDVAIVVSVRPVTAIVATQDCDAARSRFITLCEIQQFSDVEGKSKQTTSPKSWVNLLTQQARINQKWFYLPLDEKMGFADKMAVDFMMTVRVSRIELEEMRDLRKGRLNPVADEHFRERIGEFFRRYPYDEWYPLDQDELKAYMANHNGVRPFPWQ